MFIQPPTHPGKFKCDLIWRQHQNKSCRVCWLDLDKPNSERDAEEDEEDNDEDVEEEDEDDDDDEDDATRDANSLSDVF